MTLQAVVPVLRLGSCYFFGHYHNILQLELKEEITSKSEKKLM
jgi:hypothetical protein